MLPPRLIKGAEDAIITPLPTRAVVKSTSGSGVARSSGHVGERGGAA
jgi:hypothetical protein